MRVRDFFFEVIFWTPGASSGGPSAIYVYEYALCYIAIHCRSLAPDGLRTEQIPPQPGTSKYRFPAAVIPSCIPLHLSRFLAFTAPVLMPIVARIGLYGRGATVRKSPPLQELHTPKRIYPVGVGTV